MKKGLILFFIIVLIIPLATWYLGIPLDYIEGRIERAVSERAVLNIGKKRAQVGLDLRGISKHFLPGITVSKAVILLNGRDILSIEDVDIKLRLLSLLMLRPELSSRGKVAGGTLESVILLKDGAIRIRFRINSLRTGELPKRYPLSLLKGSGLLNIRGGLRYPLKQGKGIPEGEFIFKVQEMKFADIVRGQNYIPLSLFDEMSGTLKFTGSVLELGAVNLRGKGIYSRLKGKFGDGLFSGELEVMPGKDYSQALLIPIRRYRVTEGYYRIPVSVALGG